MLGLTVHSWGRQVVSENYKSPLLSQLLVRFHPRMCYLRVFLQTTARVTWQQGCLWQLGESVCLLSAVCGRWAWYFTVNVWGANFQCKDDSQGFRMCKHEAQSHFYRHWCSPTATPAWADAKLFGLPGNSQNLLRRAIRGDFNSCVHTTILSGVMCTQPAFCDVVWWRHSIHCFPQIVKSILLRRNIEKFIDSNCIIKKLDRGTFSLKCLESGNETKEAPH